MVLFVHMNDLQDRIRESEVKFNQLEQQRLEIVDEQKRLQGEYRVLKELEDTQEPNKEATTIRAVADKDDK